VTAKKSQTVCGGLALKVEIKILTALYSAPPSESQTLTESLRLRRLARAGLPTAFAAILSPLVFGEVQQ
jgi:hypothetical protein